MGDKPFGVELPTDLGSKDTAPEGTEQAPAGGAPEGSDPKVSKADGTEPSKDLLDLDKLERFRFAGREWSRKELEAAYMRQADYSKKTTELSETRKYVDNFDADLKQLLSGAVTIEDFRAVYPKNFSDIAASILASGKGSTPPAATPGNSDPNAAWIKKIETLEKRFSDWDEKQHTTEVKQIQSWLNHQFDSLAKKYPFADPEVVNAWLQSYVRKGNDVDAKALDKLFAHHDKLTKERWEKAYKEKVDKQIEAGNKGKDMGAGGGIPTGEPRQFKNFKEANKAIQEDIAAAQRSR